MNCKKCETPMGTLEGYFDAAGNEGSAHEWVCFNCGYSEIVASDNSNRINVLDHGYVELQDTFGSDLSIVSAARTSYLSESKGAEQDKKLLFYLKKNHHDGPFEMAEMRFRVYAPELCWRQILRHRSGNFNLQSFRYTEVDETAHFYVPEIWRLQSSSNKQGSEGELNAGLGDLLTARLRNIYTIGLHEYKEAIEFGVAKEIARLYLPSFGLYSTGIVKFDVRNLMHFLKLRTDEHAQWETRQFALAMETMFAEKFPWTYEAWKEYG